MPAVLHGEHQSESRGAVGLPMVWPSNRLMEELGGKPGDLVYLTDARWWLGGLRSAHAVLGEIDLTSEDSLLKMDQQTHETVVVKGREQEPIIVERLY